MRCTAVMGLDEDAIIALYSCFVATSSSRATVGVGIDSTSAFSGFSSSEWAANGAPVGGYVGFFGLGLHYVQAMESSQIGTTTFYGDNGSPTTQQSGLAVLLSM